MKEKTIYENVCIKLISFLLLPIFLILVIGSAFCIAYVTQYPEAKTKTSYYDTENFSETYSNSMYTIFQSNDYLYNKYVRQRTKTTQATQSLEEEIQATTYSEVDGEYTIYYEYSMNQPKFKYLVVLDNEKVAYTNLQQTNKTDTIQEIKEIIGNDTKYWEMEKQEIHTNIEKLSSDNIIKNNSIYRRIEKFSKDGDLYTSVGKTEDATQGYGDNFIMNQYLFEFTAQYYKNCYSIFTIAVIGSVITLIYLILSVGHKQGEKEIHLDWLDKLPLGVMGFVAFWIILSECLMVAGSVMLLPIDFTLGVITTILSAYLTGITTLYVCGSILKRIKSKTFFKNTIIAMLWKWTKKLGNKLSNHFIYQRKESIQVLIYMGLFIGISGILGILMIKGYNAAGFWLIVLIAFWIWAYLRIMKKIKEFKTIEEALKNIYEGKTDIHLNEYELQGVLKELAKYINDIAGGFSNAIEESLKSERLKTELITNVSHDIKTPLTSIINYVDLLKQEDIEDEKVKEYLEVLDSKSQRLKKLIEDLVEASKASSGNIKLVKETLNVKELIKQVSGEFSDKFEKKGLELISAMPEEEVSILADNRYLYRVLENLYSNIAKYAMEDSRVYVDLVKNGEHIIIAIKNISKEQLNISSEELMQRFVRGDQSRNTEGSGLGLSIAQSLTELQGGKFSIHLDGDLFKVVIEF